MFKTFENSSLKPVQAIKTTNTDDRYGPPTNAKTRRLAKRRLMREKDIAEASDPPVQAVVVEEISSPIPKPVIHSKPGPSSPKLSPPSHMRKMTEEEEKREDERTAQFERKMSSRLSYARLIDISDDVSLNYEDVSKQEMRY